MVKDDRGALRSATTTAAIQTPQSGEASGREPG